MTVDEALEESMAVDEALAESDLVGRPYSGGSEAMIVLAAEVRRLRANLARVEALAADYDAMPSGRGWAGCTPQSVAAAIRSRLRE